MNLAEKERNQIIPRARGEASQTIAEADAYATERTNAAKGEAARFTAIVEEYKNAPDLTRRRLFLEMFDELGPQLGGVYVLGEGSASPLPLFTLDGSNVLRGEPGKTTGGRK